MIYPSLAGRSSDDRCTRTGPLGWRLVSTDGPPFPETARWRMLLTAICALQTLLIVGWGVYYVSELIKGHAADPARAWMSVVLMLTIAAGLAAMAWGWWTGMQWPAVPSLLWHGLLLPVAWSLAQAKQWLWLAIVVSAIVLAVYSVIKVAAGESE